MTEVRDYFPELDGLDFLALHARAEEIKARPENYKTGEVGAFTQLCDLPLAELVAITRKLRAKAAEGVRRRSPRKATQTESLA